MKNYIVMAKRPAADRSALSSYKLILMCEMCGRVKTHKPPIPTGWFAPMCMSCQSSRNLTHGSAGIHPIAHRNPPSHLV